MKIRKDFVTNSSSSSFIISKNSEYNNEESIYQHIKSIVIEYKQILDDILNKLEKQYILNKNYTISDKNNKEISNKLFDSIDKDIRSKYGEIRIYDIIDYKNYNHIKELLNRIINNNTYTEYSENNIDQESFRIIDLSNENNTDGAISDIAGWYIGCYNDDISDRYKCKHCDEISKGYCYIANNNYSSDTKMYTILGKYAIYEEDGMKYRLSDYIKLKLDNISDYSCWHMG